MPAFNRTITGAKAVQDVMKSMGLAAPASISDSTNPTAIQFWQLATEVGQQMLDEHDWQFLSKEHTITTVPGTPNYAVPSDLNNYIADSSWNRTTRLPAIGSLREYEWQMLEARNLAGTTFVMLFRIEDNEVVFYETPSEVQEIVLPYNSRAWVVSALAVPQDNLIENTDVIQYDPQLFKEALKLKWMVEKKFDTTAQRAVYEDLLEKAKGKDSVGRTLTLGRSQGYPYLSVLNLPDSGYGA